jgi:hypothetical protein
VDVKRQVYYHIRHLYRQVHRIKTWQLLLILLLIGFVAATFWRINSYGMAQRRDAVLAADQEGRDEDMANRLYDLQRYTAAHMNASTGQFYLVNQYERDVERYVQTVSDDSNPNGNVNAQVDATCSPRFASHSAEYLECFYSELNKYPSAPELISALNPPNPALYRHSFMSPLWSPDFAGFSSLLFVVVALIILSRWLRFGLLYTLLKLRQRGIGS